MDEHGLSYDDMAERKTQLAEKERKLTEKINRAQVRIAEIQVLQTHIINYSKTRYTYVASPKEFLRSDKFVGRCCRQHIDAQRVTF